LGEIEDAARTEVDGTRRTTSTSRRDARPSCVRRNGGSGSFRLCDPFGLKLQLSQVRYVTSSRAAATSLAENYAGLGDGLTA
jgi:hypothetical protein